MKDDPMAAAERILARWEKSYPIDKQIKDAETVARALLATRTAQATMTIPAGIAGPNEQIVTRWRIGQTEDAVVVRPDGYRVEPIHPTQDEVERVAKALWDDGRTDASDYAWENVREGSRENCRRLARAAIAAMPGREAVIEECAAHLTTLADAASKAARHYRANECNNLASDSVRAAEVLWSAARELRALAAKPQERADG